MSAAIAVIVEQEAPEPCKFVVFETPGLIDIRAFTLMGVSAKPKSGNPIGMFGTGLKYAVATIIRLGGSIVIYVGEHRYTFSLFNEDFRDVTLQRIVMERKRTGGVFDWGSREVLPYTTQYGRNWTMEQAFRELEANTRDEDGVTVALDTDPGPKVLESTRIVVEHPDFYAAWEKRDEIFLPGAQREGHGIQVLAGESQFLYWRGMKVLKLSKPSVYTYNFLDRMELTEDRTLKYEFTARQALGDFLVRHDEETQIAKVLTAGEKSWERDIQFNNFIAPSRAFHNVAMRHPKNAPAAFHSYYSRHDERVPVAAYRLFGAHPLPWRLEFNAVVDKNDKKVFDAPYDYVGKWEIMAAELLKRINPAPL